MSPAEKSNVRALVLPVKTLARALPLWKYSHSSAWNVKSAGMKVMLGYVNGHERWGANAAHVGLQA